jgi:hypothetical protein
MDGMVTQHITAPARKDVPRVQAPLMIRTGLAIASFVIYAVATLALDQPHHVQYDTERTSLAAAVSHVVYGAPLGTIYTGVLAPLWDPSKPMQQTFKETTRREVQTGSLLKVATDGNGIGYLVITSIAMRLFGLHLSSLNYVLITLMAISTVVFVLGFRDGRLLFVPLCFLSWTIMLFTPLVTDPDLASQIPVGGIRYFSLVGILPAMHILLEISDSSKLRPVAVLRNSAFLGVQLLVLVISIVVRSSTGYLLGAIAVGCLVTVGTHVSNRTGVRNVIYKGTFTAVLAALFFALFVLWIPKEYKESGRAMGLVWHRVLISLGANPAWPFGELRNVYQCDRYVPEGLVPGIVDRNGHCVWASYGVRHGLSFDEINDGVYDGPYETAMKEAFFEIARLYPVQVLETFIYYKPMAFLSTMSQLVDIDIVGISLTSISLLVLQVLNFIAFAVCGTAVLSESRVAFLARPMVLLSVCALLPIIVAWSNPFTSADPLFYLFGALGLMLVGAIKAVRKVIRRPHSTVPI